MIMDNKYKHMDYIQSTITRMGSNSFYLKGWTITIVAAIVALSIKESDWKIYACALFLTIMFWFWIHTISSKKNFLESYIKKYLAKLMTVELIFQWIPAHIKIMFQIFQASCFGIFL